MVENKASDKAAKAKPRAKKAKPAKRAGAGRPQIEITAEQRERAAILIGGGMTLEEAAAAFDMAKNTFRKHFAKELVRSRSKKRAEILLAMFKSAVGGNVSAQKAYVALNTIASADAAWTAPEATEAGSAAKQVKKDRPGKKELAAEAALTAGIGTEWKNDLETPPLPGTKPN
jgi:predicted DNA-binding protein (UPF0251 family)